jgi:hypothetical protein
MASSLQLSASPPSDAEVVLRVGTEGGSITLWRCRDGDRWLFYMETRETFGATTRSRDMVEAWEGALALLDTRPRWVCFVPVDVHEEFRTLVVAAWEARWPAFSARPRARYIATEWDSLTTD